MITAALLINGPGRAAAIDGSALDLSYRQSQRRAAPETCFRATGLTLTDGVWGVAGNASGDFLGIQTGGTTPFAFGPDVISGTLDLASSGTHSFTSSEGDFTAYRTLPSVAPPTRQPLSEPPDRSPAAPESLSIYLLGNFVPAGGLAGYGVNNASETLALTETGITQSSLGSFSVSATFAAPASAPPVGPISPSRRHCCC